MNAKLPPAIFIMGPTAAGKTDLAMELYDRLPCEIVSVDSALIYRGMDIGTAKPSSELLAQYPHRLVDILEPSESYSAANFRNDALNAMSEITAAGKIPLLVGGTMLYFRALEKGLSELPPANSDVRARLNTELEKKGREALHRRLAEIDPESAARIHPNDPQRLQRALEVYEITGKSMSQLYAESQADALPYRVAKVVVAPGERRVLHERIEKRFHLMVEQGFVGEVRRLRARGDLDLSKPSMRAVGYRQVWEHLEGNYDFEQMLYKGIVATRQFAKRQLTWLRSDEDNKWFDGESSNLNEDVLDYLRLILDLGDNHMLC